MDAQIPGSPLSDGAANSVKEAMDYNAPDAISYEQMADCISGKAGRRAEVLALAAGDELARLGSMAKRVEAYPSEVATNDNSSKHAQAMKRNGHIAGTS